MIEEILPGRVASAEVFTDLDVVLAPDEAAAVATAIEPRRREFATGRTCARAALARLGIPAVTIGTGSHGAPLWPAGVVGSITHCDGYRAAAVASVADLRTLGIDAEIDQPLPHGVLEIVSSPSERAQLPARRDVNWDRVLFSAKESLYKAWFPLTARWLGFEDVTVVIDADDGSFTTRLADPRGAGAGAVLHGATGRWSARRGLVLTSLALGAPPTTSPGRSQRAVAGERSSHSHVRSGPTGSAR